MKSAKKKYVLVIDDDQEVKEAAKVFFELSGFAVVIAENSKDAVLKASKQRFDLVILSLEMPKYREEDILVHLLKTQNNNNLKVIAICSEVNNAQLDKIKGQVIKVFAKPLEFHKILDFIQVNLKMKLI